MTKRIAEVVVVETIHVEVMVSKTIKVEIEDDMTEIEVIKQARESEEYKELENKIYQLKEENYDVDEVTIVDNDYEDSYIMNRDELFNPEA